MKNIAIVITILLIISGCTLKLTDYVQKNQDSFLTIEGGLSDQNERQAIKLYNSLSKIDNSSILTPISGATIYVTDAKGTKINYIENEAGVYRTADNFAGQVGNSYVLHMTINGKIYESSPEIMPLAPTIDNLTFEGTVKSNLAPKDVNYSGFDVYLSFKDAPELGNHYRWFWRHYDSVGICGICQGNFDQNTGTCTAANVRFAPTYGYHCNGTCFDIKFSQDVNILADDYINGKQVDRLFISRVPNIIDENYTSGSRYYLQVEQRALNLDSYNFFNLLKSTQNTGSFFDVPALTTFNFNITCTNDNSQKILGIFDVYSAKRKVLNIDLSTKIQGADPKFTTAASYTDCIPLPCTMPCIETLTRTKTAPDGW